MRSRQNRDIMRLVMPEKEQRQEESDCRALLAKYPIKKSRNICLGEFVVT